MIPKTIHYIWLGNNPLNELSLKCLESWKKFCPDYEIKLWNESNFDVTSNEYCRQAYEKKKYAFVSDFIRVYVLYNYGGIYMDTDVELIGSLDPFLKFKAFSGFEAPERALTGIMASEKGFELLKEFLDYYENRQFINTNGEPDLTTNVKIFTDICLKYGLKQDGTEQDIKGFKLFPSDYFCPKIGYGYSDYVATERTVAVHHFNASWIDEKYKRTQGLMDEYQKRYGKGILFKFMFALAHPFLTFYHLKERKKYE